MVELLKRDDYSPSKNPEVALIDNLLESNSKDWHLWTESEKLKSRRIMAALISRNYTELLVEDRRFWTSPTLDIVNGYFEGKNKVTLEDDEMISLSGILQGVGKDINPRKNKFKKPKVPRPDK